MKKYELTPAYRCTLVRERSLKTEPSVNSSERAKKVAIEMLRDSPNERVIAILLNNKNKVIGVSEVTSGTLDASLLHPREFFRAAIISNSASVIMAHNHPSGEVSESHEDRSCFNRLKSAGDIVGITVLDSLIVGEEECISMSEGL